MTETITSHPHGAPSWADLATPDPAQSTTFYSELFGWEVSTNDETSYAMASLDGQMVAGVMQLSDEMAASGMPPCWTTYFNTTDLGETAAKVSDAGGTVLQPPMDVMEFGRMAVISDPTGAIAGLWQAQQHIGAQVRGCHGSMVWNELMTADPAAAASFYAEVLGAQTSTVPMPTGDYTLVKVAGGRDDGDAGIMKQMIPNAPSVWAVYFEVDDVDAAVTKAVDLGGRSMMEIEQVPGVGRFTAIADNVGAMFCVMTPSD